MTAAACIAAGPAGAASPTNSLSIPGGRDAASAYLRSIGCKLMAGNYKFIPHTTTGTSACLRTAGKVPYHVGHQCHRATSNQINCTWFWSELVSDWTAYTCTNSMRANGKTTVTLTCPIAWQYEPATGY